MGKKKSAERAAARPQRLDSSDEEVEEGVANEANTNKKKTKTTVEEANGKALNKPGILKAVEKLAEPCMLPDIFTKEKMQEWQRWAEETPAHLDEIPAEQRLTTVAMPMKFVARPAEPPIQPAGMPPQVELLTFKNQTTGEETTKDKLDRDAQAQYHRYLVSEDVPVQSTIAIKNRYNANADATLDEDKAVVGHDTPFFMGDVMEVEFKPEKATSSSDDEPRPHHVARVLVHYRMPYSRSAFCNDMTSPWQLACLCGQIYNKVHERGIECRKRKEAVPDSTSAVRDTTAYIDWIESEMILETQLGLTKGWKLSLPTKKRLVEHDKSWTQALRM